MRNGEFGRAVRLARPLVEQTPNAPNARALLAAALLGAAKFEEALELLEPLARAYPTDPAILCNLANAYRAARRFDDAIKTIDRALAVQPEDPQLVAAKTRILVGAGRLDDAISAVDAALVRMRANPYLAVEFARLADVDRVEQALRHVDAASRLQIPPPLRHALAFARADLLDRAARYDEAFDAYANANAARHMPWDPDEHTARIDAMIEAWTPDRLADLPRAGRDAKPTLIFIVGMPRSGTTLVDQILSMHPDVHAGGEQMIIPRTVARLAATPKGVLPLLVDPSSLSQPLIDAAATKVRSHYASLDDAPIVTDKFPQNMLHLGAISLLTPGARVVHCRRDPLDTCLSCYFQNFLGTMPYMYDLDHIGRFYADYHRLMDHWAGALDLEVLDLDYERLVGEQEAHTRRLLDFLHLDWNADCLRFHESKQGVITASETQVARPIYTSSVQRWRRYASHLRPLEAPLRHLLTSEQQQAITA